MKVLPELLAPAGSPEALDAAIAEGADAVYLGLKTFNARIRSANFAYSQFEGAVRSLHRMGRKVYVTVNTVFEQREADRVYQLLKYLAAVGPDGIIVQDFGLLLMAKEFPQLKIHASTQMNIASAMGANVLSKYGVSRVVLARELSLEEIKNISLSTNVELEVFVHGALCASVSGLCLFSSYLGGKSANRGLCTQACRRLYHAGTEAGYYFSPCDISLIGRIPELAKAGVKSFKIEGRMKSAEYVGTVVSAYRLVIDSMEGTEDERRCALEEAGSILQNDFARPKTEFFMEPDIVFKGGIAITNTGEKPPFVFRPQQDGGTGISLGVISKVSGSGADRRAVLKGGSRIKILPGDSVRLHKADDSNRKAHKLTFAKSQNRNNVGANKVGDGSCVISVPEGFEAGDSVYLIQTKSMTKRYPPVIKDISSCKRQPGRERAPLPPDAEIGMGRGATRSQALSPKGKQSGKKNASPPTLPEGLFVAVASIEDLYIVQSVKPAAVILPVNQKTITALLDDKPLPFKPSEIILALDPFFPQSEESFLAELPEQLGASGYCSFICNNPGHFSLFKGQSHFQNLVSFENGSVSKVTFSKTEVLKKPRQAAKSAQKPFLLIAGPWLYTFNSWSAAFISSLGAKFCISPLENNRQNLEKTIVPKQRSSILVTLYAYPPLFRIRTGTDYLYRFGPFSDSREETFSLINGKGSALVIPAEPLSITDKRSFLQESGFRRFILDFSAGQFNGSFPLKKKLYKEVIKAAMESIPLAETSRFNWKNGFFSEKTT